MVLFIFNLDGGEWLDNIDNFDDVVMMMIIIMFIMGNNIACVIRFNHRMAAILYTLETEACLRSVLCVRRYTPMSRNLVCRTSFFKFVFLIRVLS